jgi:hypothetical protein
MCVVITWASAEDGYRSSYYKDGEIHVNVLGQPEGKVPNLVDFNGDGFLDIFLTRHSPVSAEQNRGDLPLLGNTFLLSDGAWDRFVDVSAKTETRNERAYSYKRGGALDAHLGLGKATSADITVKLLNGKTKAFARLAADRSHVLEVAAP